MARDASAIHSPARSAAAAAAVELVEPEMTVGLGSGRAVWETIELMAQRWPDGPPVRAVVASKRTAEVSRAAGIELVQLDGERVLDLALDGADEVGPGLDLLKGGGGALLREKIVIRAARRFVVVAQEHKRVERLGRAFRLPVEVVPFGWRDTRARVLELVEDAILREEAGDPYVTDGGHWILDCRLRPDGDVRELAAALKAVVGVVEHGLFLGTAERGLLGRDDGTVLDLSRDAV